MPTLIAREVAALKRLGVKDLKARYAELFGEATATGNKDWLVKRIAWRVQALAEGDLSERARRRAEELANDADLRLRPPKGAELPGDDPPPTVPFCADGRLPPPGGVITRRYKGRDLRVTVMEDGFLHDGHVYPSLSAVAKSVTGSHCNGFLFFRLNRQGERT